MAAEQLVQVLCVTCTAFPPNEEPPTSERWVDWAVAHSKANRGHRVHVGYQRDVVYVDGHGR